MTNLAIDRDDIEDAADRIAPHVRLTPTMTVDARDFGLEVDATITLKLEGLQHAGSFKTRGAFNRTLSNEVTDVGLITASGGNHGVAVSHVAARLGHRAEVFVTETTPEAKIARIRANGAEVVIAGRYYDDAQAASSARALETGALVVHPFNQPETLAGQGTLGRELERQAPDLDSVLVAVGGGGLIAGVAAWYEGRVRVISVEPELIPAMSRALEAGTPVEVEVRWHRGRLPRHEGDRRARLPDRAAVRRRRCSRARRCDPPCAARVVGSGAGAGRARRGRRDGGAAVRCLPAKAGGAHRCHRVRRQHRPRGGPVVTAATVAPSRSRANNRPDVAGESNRNR